MKKLIQLSSVLTIFSIVVLGNSPKAQDLKKNCEMMGNKFAEAYNKKDYKMLAAMYTKDCVWVRTDGTTVTGNDAVIDALKQSRESGDLTIMIMTDKAEMQSDGTVMVEGTYHVTGKAASGEAIDQTATFTNTLKKDGDKWLIAKNVGVTKS